MQKVSVCPRYADFEHETQRMCSPTSLLSKVSRDVCCSCSQACCAKYTENVCPERQSACLLHLLVNTCVYLLDGHAGTWKTPTE